jgi:hypothetical protein
MILSEGISILTVTSSSVGDLRVIYKELLTESHFNMASKKSASLLLNG